MSALRIGIVGARFAAELHATNYRPLLGPRVELAAVCSRTRGQAEDFARRHAIPRVFTDYLALVESPDVDVVDICATTDSHHEIAVAAPVGDAADEIPPDRRVLAVLTPTRNDIVTLAELGEHQRDVARIVL